MIQEKIEHPLAKAMPIVEDLLNEEVFSDEVISDIEIFRRKGQSLPAAVANSIIQETERLDMTFIQTIKNPNYIQGDPPYTKIYYPMHVTRILWAEEYIRSTWFVNDHFEDLANQKRNQLYGFEEFFGKPFGSFEDINKCVAEYTEKHLGPTSAAKFHIQLSFIAKLLVKDPSGFLMIDTLFEKDKESYLKNSEETDQRLGFSEYGELLHKIHFGLMNAGRLNYKKYYRYFKQ